MCLTPEEIQELQDQEYYWIVYRFPSDGDETWAVGKYDKKFEWFGLCGKTIITVGFVIEAQVVERSI
jgi:hypothetical protein